MVSTEPAAVHFPELAQALIAKNRDRIKRRTGQSNCTLQTLSLDTDLIRRAELIGWHRVARELSEELGVAVRRVRLRLAELKAAESKSQLGHTPP